MPVLEQESLIQQRDLADQVIAAAVRGSQRRLPVAGRRRGPRQEQLAGDVERPRSSARSSTASVSLPSSTAPADPSPVAGASCAARCTSPEIKAAWKALSFRNPASESSCAACAK